MINFLLSGDHRVVDEYERSLERQRQRQLPAAAEAASAASSTCSFAGLAASPARSPRNASAAASTNTTAPSAAAAAHSPRSRSPTADITTPRRWTRRRCAAPPSDAEEGGLVRMTKLGDVKHVPWNDPPPSVLFRHVAAKEERSCLDFADEPVFTSFSGRFSLTRLTRPVDIGAAMELPPEPLATRLHRAHKVLERAEEEAQEILPPPARVPRLPVPVAEAVDVDMLAAYDAQSSQRPYDSPSFSLPPSTNMFPSPPSVASGSQRQQPQLARANSLSRLAQLANALNGPDASPSKQQHHNSEPGHSYQREVLDVSPRRFPVFNRQLGTAGAIAMAEHVAPTMQSVPRPSHSPRALKQFMSPEFIKKANCAEWGSMRLNQPQGTGATPNRPQSSSRPVAGAADSISTPSAARSIRAAEFSLFGSPDAFESPGRTSSEPIGVGDLVAIMAKPRPQSARVSQMMSSVRGGIDSSPGLSVRPRTAAAGAASSSPASSARKPLAGGATIEGRRSPRVVMM